MGSEVGALTPLCCTATSRVARCRPTLHTRHRLGSPSSVLFACLQRVDSLLCREVGALTQFLVALVHAPDTHARVSRAHQDHANEQ